MRLIESKNASYNNDLVLATLSNDINSFQNLPIPNAKYIDN